MQKYIVLIAMIVMLSGCAIDFGATDRTQIRANAAVAVAQAERDAAIGSAEAEASKSKAWAMVMVPLAMVIMGGAVVLMVVYWQGKTYYARATQYTMQQITANSENDLKRYARQLGGKLAIDDQGYKIYLPGGKVQRLLQMNGE